MGQAKRYDIDSSYLRPVKKVPDSPKMDAMVFNHQGSMGDSLDDNRAFNQQHDGSKVFVHRISRSIYGYVLKRYQAMAGGKMMLFFIDFLGIPIFTYSALLHLGDIKGFILFILAFFYAIARLWFYIDRQKDESKLRKMKLEEKEFDLHEKIGDD